MVESQLHHITSSVPSDKEYNFYDSQFPLLKNEDDSNYLAGLLQRLKYNICKSSGTLEIGRAHV